MYVGGGVVRVVYVGGMVRNSNFSKLAINSVIYCILLINLSQKMINEPPNTDGLSFYECKVCFLRKLRIFW